VKETSRKELWLAAWVIGFAVAMACLLLGFKHHAVLDGLQRERLQLVADGLDAVIERNLAFGLAFRDIVMLPDVLDSQKSADPLIGAIEVVDMEGAVVYATERSRVGARVPQPWRSTMAAAKRGTWHASADGEAAVGTVVRNAFGLPLGHVMVRYRTDGLEAASAAFARHLAWTGAVIAAMFAVFLFILLRLVQSLLELRLARAGAALAHGEAPAGAGSFSAEAAAAGRAMREAQQALDAVELALDRPQAGR
jgi:hypothetical protein